MFWAFFFNLSALCKDQSYSFLDFAFPNQVGSLVFSDIADFLFSRISSFEA